MSASRLTQGRFTPAPGAAAASRKKRLAKIHGVVGGSVENGISQATSPARMAKHGKQRHQRNQKVFDLRTATTGGFLWFGSQFQAPFVQAKLNSLQRSIQGDSAPNCVVSSTDQLWHDERKEDAFWKQSGRGEVAVDKKLPHQYESRGAYGRMADVGNEFDLFQANCLMDMHVKWGNMGDAQRVFDDMQSRNVVSWNIMIMGYTKRKEGALGLKLYARMRQEGFTPDGRTFVGALKACSSLAGSKMGEKIDGRFEGIGCLEKGRAIHSQLVKSGFESDIFVGTSLLDMYAKCGSMAEAQHVFNQLPDRDVVSWATMILGYAEKKEGDVALQLYAEMQQEGVLPNERIFVGVLKSCGSLAALEEVTEVDGKFVKRRCLEKGRAIHSQIAKSGFETNTFVGNTLIDMYAKCGSMVDALHAFDSVPHRDVVSWTSIILGCAQKEEGEVALHLYARMHREGFVPDDRIFVGVLKACSSLAALEDGDGRFLKSRLLEKCRSIHCQVVRSGFESDLFVGTALMDMYVKCGSLMDVWHIFDKLPRRDVVSWTTMILGHAENIECEVALQLYAWMHQQGVAPNDRTFVGAMKACANLAALEEGKEVNGKSVKIRCLDKGRAIHSQVAKSEFLWDVYVGTTLVDMYAKCGSMEDAWHVFDKLPHPNVASWTAMISGYAEQGQSEQAFSLYAQMQQQGLLADSLTFVSILKACSNTAALEAGKEIHAQVCRVGLENTGVVTTSLIDMYGKCGSMDCAQQLFDASPTRGLAAWNALISGYARQGASDLVFHFLEKMRQVGKQPDGITFLHIVSLCRHVGIVEEGQKYFESMTEDHDMTQSMEHYLCMVDLLGRAGQLSEAVAMVEGMPFQPNLVAWRTVLAACRKWNDVELARHAFERAVRLDGKHAAAYVLMANIYADARMWKESEKIQAMRRDARAWKRPGQSWWTDMDGIVHTFAVGDENHPQINDIYAKLEDLSVKMKQQGYVPHLDSVLWDISDGEKQDALCGHSERLAIACALLKTPPGTAIRIVKNLRVCDDCHKAIAFISKIEQRNIICRDVSRFHDYKDGKCSCGDSW